MLGTWGVRLWGIGIGVNGISSYVSIWMKGFSGWGASQRPCEDFESIIRAKVVPQPSNRSLNNANGILGEYCSRLSWLGTVIGFLRRSMNKTPPQGLGLFQFTFLVEEALTYLSNIFGNEMKG